MWECNPTPNPVIYGGCHTGGVLCGGLFPFFAPAVWGSGDFSMFPYSLSGNQWASALIGPPERRHYYELTIDGLGPGQISLKDIFTTHPDPAFPGSFEWKNRFAHDVSLHGYALNVWYLDDDSYLATRARWIGEFPCGIVIHGDMPRFTLPAPGIECNAIYVQFAGVTVTWVRIDNAAAAATAEAEILAKRSRPNWAIRLSAPGAIKNPLWEVSTESRTFEFTYGHPNGPFEEYGEYASNFRSVVLSTNCGLGVISPVSRWQNGVWVNNGVTRGLDWHNASWSWPESQTFAVFPAGVCTVSWTKTISNYSFFESIGDIPAI